MVSDTAAAGFERTTCGACGEAFLYTAAPARDAITCPYCHAEVTPA